MRAVKDSPATPLGQMGKLGRIISWVSARFDLFWRMDEVYLEK